MGKDVLGGTASALVCGIPGSGKTTYSRWLTQEKGFHHLDFDELLSGRGTPAQLDLIELLKTSPEDFVRKLSKKRPTVIDWGFPPSSISLIRLLQSRGIAVWWFDGDREAARQSFTARDTVSLDDFRTQMEAIEMAWNSIKEVVADGVINTIAAGPTYLAPERIFVEMFGSSD